MYCPCIASSAGATIEPTAEPLIHFLGEGKEKEEEKKEEEEEEKEEEEEEEEKKQDEEQEEKSCVEAHPFGALNQQGLNTINPDRPDDRLN